MLSASMPVLCRTSCLLAATLLALAGCAAFAESEPVDLPIEAELVAKFVAVDLRGGEVEVVLADDADPQLIVTDLLRPENTDGFVVVEQDGGRLRLTQPHGADTVAPRLRVKIVAHPDTVVEIEGERLNIVVHRFGAPAVEPIAPPGDDDRTSADALPAVPGSGSTQGAAAPAALRLDVRQSSATLTGVAGQWKGRDSHFRAEGVRGVLAVDVEGGRFVLEGFAGQLDLRASDAEVELAEVNAGVALRLDHASLLAESGAGRAAGTASASTVVFRRWYGGVAVQGDDNRIDLAQAGLREVPVSCSGRSNEIQLEQIPGPVNVDMADGRLTGRRLLSLSTIRAHDGAEVVLQTIKGRIDLELAERCRASVEGADLSIDVRATASEVTLASIHDFELRATSATVTAADVVGSARVRAGDSELDLDLRGVTNSPDLDLSGSTKARITLPTPCVLTLDRSEEMRDRVELSGCEIYDGRQRVSAPPGKRLILTRAKIGPDARLIARSAN
jgi:hypothetical protein